jgi:hypothetical protein
MSYDLMVFRSDSAPRTRPEFMTWYHDQTKWAEGHSYNDPIVTSDELKSWFMEMIKTFPAMNGPYAVDDPDNEFVTDYCIGKDVIYVTFAWSIAEKAYEVMKNVADKHRVGFFDASANDGDILFPDNSGKNKPIDKPNNLSSIQQIKKSATPGQESNSVKEILYSKINLQSIVDQTTTNNTMPKAGRKWWQKLFGFK